MADLELRRQRFLYVRGWFRMTSPEAGDLQSKSRSKANFSSFWSRSGGRRRRATLMLKFRKIEMIWLKSWCFGCANSRKRRFQGRFSGGKRVESGVSLVKCVNSVHVQLRSPTNVLLESYWRKRKKIQCLHAEESSSRGWKKALFRDKISEFRAVEGR